MSNINVSAQPIHPLASLWHKLWEDSICEWPLNQKRPIFCLILKVSHALDSLFSVLFRLLGRTYICAFCWMKHHWMWLVSDIVAWDSIEHTIYLFSEIDAVTFTFQVSVGTYFLNFRLALLWFCLLIVLRALVYLI